MKMFPEILLLASVGLLHFERADADFPENGIVITMHDGCTSRGELNPGDETPQWIRPSQINETTNHFFFYIRFQHHQHAGHFNPPTIIFAHDPLDHTPRSVQIHIRFVQQERSEFYMANRFKAYNPEPQYHRRWYPQGYFPADNYIYVAVPRGQKYRALLIPQPFEKTDDRLNNVFPGIPDPSRRWISRHDPFSRHHPYHRDSQIF